MRLRGGLSGEATRRRSGVFEHPARNGTSDVRRYSPNITGWFSLGQNQGHVPKCDGTLFYFSDSSFDAAASTNLNHAYETTFDPSRANPIFGASSTVQPSSLQALPCIKI